MNNAAIETLRKTLVKVLDMPDFADMPIGTKYYVLKDVFGQVENQFFKAIEQELRAGKEDDQDGVMAESVQ